MRYVAAYLLASLGGKDNPTASDLQKIIGSVGIESEDDKIKTIIGELNGKDLEELIAKGQEKLASVPAGGAVAAAGGGGGAAPAEDKKEAKEEKKQESESESDDDMGFGLFD